MYVYIRSDEGVDDEGGVLYLYTVGFYDPLGNWHDESDHTNRENAASRVHYLNGGDEPCPT